MRGASGDVLTVERGVASPAAARTASAGGPGSRPPGVMAWQRASRWPASSLALLERTARVPGRKSPRWSAETGLPVAREGPRLAHAVVAPRKRDKTIQCASRRSIHPSLGEHGIAEVAKVIAGSPAEAKAEAEVPQERRTRAHQRAARTKKTALFDIVS
jgi:hypothetical protein